MKRDFEYQRAIFKGRMADLIRQIDSLDFRRVKKGRGQRRNRRNRS